MDGETLANGDQQQVWGVSYIDELVQEGVNSNPAGQSTCDRLYCQDAGYNVNLLVELSLSRSQPFGDDGWTAQTVKNLGLEHSVRGEGGNQYGKEAAT